MDKTPLHLALEEREKKRSAREAEGRALLRATGSAVAAFSQAIAAAGFFISRADYNWVSFFFDEPPEGDADIQTRQHFQANFKYDKGGELCFKIQYGDGDSIRADPETPGSDSFEYPRQAAFAIERLLATIREDKL